MSVVSRAPKRPLDLPTLELRDESPVPLKRHKYVPPRPLAFSFAASFPAAPHLSSVNTPTPPTTPAPMDSNESSAPATSGEHFQPPVDDHLLHGLGIHFPADQTEEHGDEAMYDAAEDEPTFSPRSETDLDMTQYPSVVLTENSYPMNDPDNSSESCGSTCNDLSERREQPEGSASNGESQASPYPGKARFRMGFRSDCQKCRDKVPGHWSHY